MHFSCTDPVMSPVVSGFSSDPIEAMSRLVQGRAPVTLSRRSQIVRSRPNTGPSSLCSEAVIELVCSKQALDRGGAKRQSPVAQLRLRYREVESSKCRCQCTQWSLSVTNVRRSLKMCRRVVVHRPGLRYDQVPTVLGSTPTGFGGWRCAEVQGRISFCAMKHGSTAGAAGPGP